MRYVCKNRLGPARRRELGGRIAVVGLALALATGGMGASAREEGSQRIDLNRASAEELMSLPGVGAAKAQAIVEHRRTAPFRKIEELLQVKGIGDSIYAGLRDRITVSGEAAPDGAAPPESPREGASGGRD
jgi:competence protein ComEA